MLRRAAIAACILFDSCAFAASAAPEPSPSRMDQIVQSYVDGKQFMGTVLVARGDRVVFSQGYGSANLEWNIPNTTTTRFRIGSLTKQFTAAAILLLEEQGKLKVDDFVRTHYAEAPVAWDKITLFHLLTHTSGIPTYTGLPGFDDFSLRRRTPEELVKYFRDQPLEFEPGAEYRYSNSGYAVLGVIIEKLSGSSYPGFLDQSIFKPLGMKDTGFDDNLQVIPGRASAYGYRRGEILNVQNVDASVLYSSGGLSSTVEDLLRWERALFQNKLLSTESFQAMTTPFKGGYAFGLEIEEKHGVRVIEHGGSVVGFKAKLAYYPGDAITVIALSNIPALGAENIADKLGALALGQKVILQSERVESKLSEKVLLQYAGVYELRPGVDIVVGVSEHRLTAQLGRQPPDTLYAESKDYFFSKLFDADFKFVRDHGKVTQMILIQGGREQTARRK